MLTTNRTRPNKMIELQYDLINKRPKYKFNELNVT